MANEHGRFKCVRRLMAWRLGRSCPTLSSQKHAMTRYFIPNAVVRALLFRYSRPTLSAVSSLPFHYESTKTNRKEAYSSMAKI